MRRLSHASAPAHPGWFLPLLLAATLLAACDEVPSQPCSADQDCGPCEACVDGSCEIDPAQLNAAGSCGAEPSDGGAESDASSPDHSASDLSTLDTAEADASAPDSARPDSSSPDSSAHDSSAHDSSAPDTSAPDSLAPDTALPDTSLPDTALPDTTPVDAARPDAGPLYEPCEPPVLPCLDPAPAEIIEAPTELEFADAMASASANQTIQVRGLRLGAGWRVPPYVTLRGCAGATIEGNIGFEGSGGVIEGFEVIGDGSIFANHTGAYVVRRNRLLSDQGNWVPGVLGDATDALVSADVTVTIERNLFQDRRAGVFLATDYQTLTHRVQATVRNNVFHQVEQPLRVSEGGLVGEIEARIEHNTFYDFTEAISLNSVSAVTTTSGNLFASGDLAVGGNSQFEAHYSVTWEVTTQSTLPPFGGAFAVGEPGFVDPPGHDLRPTQASAVLDLVPAATTVPATDFFGCPRPVDYWGGGAKADCGAIEAQR